MVAKMMGPQGVSANALSKKVGIHQPTLSRWLKVARIGPVSKAPKRSGRGGPPKRWSAEEKLRVVKQAAGLEGSALGELLRREGLHEADLQGFEAEALVGLAPAVRSTGPSPEAKRIAELERQLLRKDKALAEAAAILILRKKVEALWEGEGGDTDKKNER
jgi:transposase-like protein